MTLATISHFIMPSQNQCDVSHSFTICLYIYLHLYISSRTLHRNSLLHLIMCHNYSIPLIHSSLCTSLTHLITLHSILHLILLLHTHSSNLYFHLQPSEVFVVYSLIKLMTTVLQKSSFISIKICSIFLFPSK